MEAEQRREDERRLRHRGDWRSTLNVIGIMGWSSGGSDASDGALDETGAKFTAAGCLSVFIVET